MDGWMDVAGMGLPAERTASSKENSKGGGVLDRPTFLPVPSSAPTKPASQRQSSATNMASVRVYSITRSEIEKFWRRKEVEAEERCLAAEKEAARIKAKKLKMEDYLLFEQMIMEILKEGNAGDGAPMAPAAASGIDTEARIIGIKHWWTRSAYAYLNAPALPMDENSRRKHAITYVPQEKCTMLCSSTPCQSNSTAFAIF